MKTWSVKRRLLIGMLIAGTMAGSGLAAASVHKERVLSSDPLVRELQNIYGAADASDIQIGKLEALPVQHTNLTTEQRGQRLAAIETELKRLEEEQAKYEAAAADAEQGISAVEADFAHGVLSAGDKAMLMQLFSGKRDNYRQAAAESIRQNAELSKEKQQLINFHEPDTIEYGQARVDTGKSIVTRIVFYNATAKRLLTKEEIAAQPTAADIAKRLPDREESKPNEYPLIAGMAGSVALAVLIWRRLPIKRRTGLPEFLRQGT